MDKINHNLSPVSKVSEDVDNYNESNDNNMPALESSDLNLNSQNVNIKGIESPAISDSPIQLRQQNKVSKAATRQEIAKAHQSLTLASMDERLISTRIKFIKERLEIIFWYIV